MMNPMQEFSFLCSGLSVEWESVSTPEDFSWVSIGEGGVWGLGTTGEDSSGGRPIFYLDGSYEEAPSDSWTLVSVKTK